MLIYLGIPRERKRCYTFFPVTRELRVILDRRVVACEVKPVGVFPAKTSTCSCLFTARVEKELGEIPCYVATEKM